jgi:YVTN family beta-propeller protein
VSVIATATNTVVATIAVGIEASGVAVTPDSNKIYVVNTRDNTVSVIVTETNTVTATIPVGSNPVAFGVFIQPRFAGPPGRQTVTARVSRRLLGSLAGSMHAAAAALGFSGVKALQNAILAFCAG